MNPKLSWTFSKTNQVQNKQNRSNLEKNWNVSSNIWDRRAWDPALFWHLWTVGWGRVPIGSISWLSEGEDEAAAASSAAAGSDATPCPSTPALRRVDCKFTNRTVFRVCHKASCVVDSCVCTCRLYCFSDLQTEKQQRHEVMNMQPECKWLDNKKTLLTNPSSATADISHAISQAFAF